MPLKKPEKRLFKWILRSVLERNWRPLNEPKLKKKNVNEKTKLQDEPEKKL